MVPPQSDPGTTTFHSFPSSSSSTKLLSISISRSRTKSRSKSRSKSRTKSRTKPSLLLAIGLKSRTNFQVSKSRTQPPFDFTITDYGSTYQPPWPPCIIAFTIFYISSVLTVSTPRIRSIISTHFIPKIKMSFRVSLSIFTNKGRIDVSVYKHTSIES
ncbi:hypothetical protein L2E82_18024 [Cichorium intybus]|uniref:Uncharacterized protein n=1 Tax=Cichorium intybus TaxID=13427 RepID=A0ACB9F9A4_CICIN|nr:hypothetical protein L2E82_18024 [Cichorium intybus]